MSLLLFSRFWKPGLTKLLLRFYFRVYLLSPIPHEVHHLAWSLETLPTWPHIAVEHYSRPENSTNQLGLELHEVTPSLTEQELDFIEAGLETTYHPVVVKRLQEMRELRLERNGGGGKGPFISFSSQAIFGLTSSGFFIFQLPDQNEDRSRQLR